MNKFKKREKKENFHHNKKKDIKQKNTNRDPSNVRCYTGDEKGHSRNCPIRKRRHHAHVSEEDEPTNKIFIREKDDLDKEYVPISSLTSSISYGSNDWHVDNGYYKHIT